MKLCLKCKTEKPETLGFFPLNKRSGGFYSPCRKCTLKRTSAWRKQKKAEDPEYRELLKETFRRWNKVHQKERRASYSEWYEKVKLQRRVTNADYMKNYRKAVRQTVLDALGKVCECCGESEDRFLTLEHKNGGGGLHRKRLKTTHSVFKDIQRRGFPKEEFGVLCMNCNFATRFGELCPHKKEA